MRVLLDTCILIDVLQNRSPFASEAQALIDAAARKHYQAYATAKEVADIYYIMRKDWQNETKARKMLSNLFSVISILDTTASQVEIAFGSSVSDYEDAIMTQAALENDLDLIVTRNLKDYQLSPVPVCSPAECLEKIGVDSWG